MYLFYLHLERNSVLDGLISQILVRGRAFDESKPETFNQLWTVEEQRRLEELLIEYPPEEIEMRRWTKIANALGMLVHMLLSKRDVITVSFCRESNT